MVNPTEEIKPPEMDTTRSGKDQIITSINPNPHNINVGSKYGRNGGVRSRNNNNVVNNFKGTILEFGATIGSKNQNKRKPLNFSKIR